MLPPAAGHLFAAVAIGGLGYAAYRDLLTTEVSDTVSIAIAAVSVLFYAAVSVDTGTMQPVLGSLVTGTAFFLAGWAMYLAGMWGGADAFVLGATGFAFHTVPPGIEPLYQAPWPVPVSLVLGIMVAGSVFSICYAALVAARFDGFLAAVRARLAERAGWYVRLAGAYLLVAGGAGLYIAGTGIAPAGMVATRFLGASLFLAASLLLMVVLRVIQDEAMEREIDVADLQEGDILAEEYDIDVPGVVDDDPVEQATAGIGAAIRRVSPVPVPELSDRYGTRVVGVTPAEVEVLRERGGTVTVKTGVPFIAAFPIAAILLMTLGDPVFAFALALA